MRRIIKIQLSQLAGWNDWTIVKFTEQCFFPQKTLVLVYRGFETVFGGIFVNDGKYHTNAWFGMEDVFFLENSTDHFLLFSDLKY